MKNKLAKIVAVFTVVGLVSAGPVAYAVSEEDNLESGMGYKRQADQGSMQGKPMQGGPMQGLMGLDLTPSQQAEVMALQDPAKQNKIQAMAEQVRTKMQMLNAAIAEPGTTLTDVSDLIEEIGTLQAQSLSQRMEYLFAMKKILTPEQFAKMQEMKKERQGPGGFGGQNPRPDQGNSGEQNPGPDQY
ncbi:MAG: Spy/CpxP family protein refolding chaperone [Candidatus Omnitrophota bacterium]